MTKTVSKISIVFEKVYRFLQFIKKSCWLMKFIKIQLNCPTKDSSTYPVTKEEYEIVHSLFNNYSISNRRYALTSHLKPTFNNNS